MTVSIEITQEPIVQQQNLENEEKKKEKNSYMATLRVK